MNGFNLSEWALRHRSLVVFFMLLVVVAGVYSYQQLGRNEDPTFTIKTMVVQVYWPGASVADTLEQVTDRIEKKLQETPGLDYTRSYTSPGQSTVFVTLTGATRSKDVPNIWYQVRKKVADIRQTLPQGVLGPFFNDEFGDTYGIVYAFTSDGFTDRELRDYVEDVRSRLLRVKDVGKIDIFGVQDEKIYIEFSVQQLSGLKVDRLALIEALQAQNAVTPAGVVQTKDEKIRIEVSGGFRSEADLEKVNFVSNGHMLRLSDIATVTRKTADPPQPKYHYNGQPAVGLALSMRDGGDILEMGRNVDKAMRDITATLPIGIEPNLVANQPEVVERAVDEFMEALWEAVAIVLAVSFLSLGLRAGTVVAFSIPLVLASVFMIMDVAHIDLQRVSLGALIISLGLLVDDAMITVESMVTRLDIGWDKTRAATFAYTSTAFPMLTGTLVTVCGFVPIGFARSSAGEYTFSLFAVVAIALIMSWFVAVVFAPLVGAWILRETPGRKAEEGTNHRAPGPILRAFRGLLLVAMRWRWATITLTLAVLVLSGYAFQFVPQQFFPASNRPELLVDLKLTEASSIYATEKTATEFEALLKDDPDIYHFTTYIGRGAVRFYLPLNVQLQNDFFAQSVIVAKDMYARERVRARLEKAVAEKFPWVVARMSALELGPPVGWPIQYRVSGPEPEKVRDIANQVAAVVASDKFADKIGFDWMVPQRVLRIKVNQDQAQLLGIDSQSLAQAVNTVVSGVTVTQVRDGIYLIDVVARARDEDRISPETLRTLQVPLPNGKTAPLAQVAELEYAQDWPIVWRRDRLSTLTVQADVRGGALPATVVKDLRADMDKLGASLPAGYTITAGGSEEESHKSLASLIAVFPVAVLIMLVFLMFQLQSFNRLFLVLSVAPFGLIGVVAALLASGKPLGFIAILGVVSLVGMIVRNSVILVDQIKVEIAAGLAPWDAVLEATTHRFRPILLTAAAAILGMIPIAPSVFFGPMAYAIMGGLAIATVLTLIFLPALYVAWFRIRET